VDTLKILWIALAGGAGSVARYLLDGAIQKRLGPSFPYGILAVNMIGCFLIAVVMQAGLAHPLLSPETRIIIATGFLGGFTTYSTFNYETMRYLQEGQWFVGLGYLAATMVGCLAAGALGWICGVRFRS
jgi:CrcB protein